MRRLVPLLAAALFAVAGPALAVPLVVGDNPLPGTTVAARPELAGTVLEDRIVPFSLGMGAEVLDGVVQQRVVREDATGTLDFYWKITTDATDTLPILSFRLAGFDGFITDGDWRIDGLGTVAPTSALVFAQPGFVNFQFGNPVGPDSESRFFFLHTSATRYADTGRYDIVCGPTGCVTDQYTTFAPTAVPEATTWAMMILGFVGAGSVIRRRPLLPA
jgi:hypothetical protein